MTMDHNIGQNPYQISDDKSLPAVFGYLEIPKRQGIHPAVIILYGAAGWRQDYISLAKAYSNSGFVSLVLDYFAVTGQGTTEAERQSMWPQWQAMIRNAIMLLKNHSASKDRPIGLIGYSMGAFLAVSVASSSPDVKAVVDFFGGGRPETIENDIINFPPLLILHGEEDKIVPVSNAYTLRNAVITQGGHVEMHIYQNEQHAFSAVWSSNYSQSASSDSFHKTIDFLRRQLNK
jgi:carboxymethylenebutenolidase